jgi:hypothetical protein
MNKAFLLLLCAAGAFGAGQPGLVVLEFQSRGILDKTVLRQMWDRTWEVASSYPGANAVPAEETRRRIFDQNVLLPNRCDEACYQRVALKLQADRILVPSVEKTGDQLKFSFVLVQGESGKKLQEVSVWSDGRVDRALAAGLAKVMADAGGNDAVEVPSALWTTVGIGAAGLAGALWFGLSQDRSPAAQQKTPSCPNGGIYPNCIDI